MSDELTNTFSRIALSDALNPECLPFNLPPLRREVDHRLQRQDIPRFLFRLSTPKSDGTTGDDWVRSKDASAALHQEDVFARQDRRVAAAEVSDHLWWVDSMKRRDNLVSWTSSLLFACQYALYRHHQYRDASQFDVMELLVIDTTMLPQGVFLRDLDLIKAFANLDARLSELWKLRTTGYYFGEYLSQGALRVNGKCSLVSIKDMIKKGLFDLQPEFTDYVRNRKITWATEVNRLRMNFSSHDQASISLTRQAREAAVNVASLFKPEFRLPVVANVLSLSPHQFSERSLLDTFRSPGFHGLDKNVLSPRNTKIIDYGMPEVKQVREIMAAAYADHVRQRLEQATGYITNAELEIRHATLAIHGMSHEDIKALGISSAAIFRKLTSVITLCDALAEEYTVPTDG